MNSPSRTLPKMDIIITVCDQAAGELCQEWPGQPVTAHWGVEDPAAAAGDDDAKRAAFLRAFSVLKRRINLLASLHPTALNPLTRGYKAGAASNR
jgi:arsenate reductase (thioredoxin)